MKIDSHQHFWIYNEEEYEWINEDMMMLRRDFLPGDLIVELRKTGYRGCVAVQARQSEKETQFLLHLMEKNPSIKGVVGWLDLQANDIGEKLEQYGKYPNLKGLRHIVQSEPDPEFLLRPSFLKGISLLKNYDLTYDILIFPQHLAAAIKFVTKFPEQKFVLDHLAKPLIKDKKSSPWKQDLHALAVFPNVYCKLSGMVTEASWNSWHKDDFSPYLDIALQAFGAERLMIGSDWPVCLLAASYEAVMEITGDYISKLSKEEQRKIMGTNACAFYNLS
ncbi:MAG: amidohydrolase family protein [Cyclobacteriaceae bacterium]